MATKALKTIVKAKDLKQSQPKDAAKKVTKVLVTKEIKKEMITKEMKTEVKKAEVKKVEVKKAEVKKAEVKKVEVKKAEVKKVDPKKVEKSQGKVIESEAELLKMSDKDYMNKEQLQFFKDRLQKLKEDILKNAESTTVNLRENTLVPDPADRATIEEEHALELRTRDRERKLLKKVEQALSRIESSEYGWCEETGEAIGLSRLLARPTANLSLEAQERRELRQKLFGD